MIICGFPGVGKSSWAKKEMAENAHLLDLDYTDLKESWPYKYIAHLVNYQKNKRWPYLLSSSHKEVREGLVEYDMPFACVYPSKDQKQEYLERYKNRGSSEEFIKLLDEKWDEWITSMEEQKCCLHIVLRPGQFLSDVLK